MMDPNELGRRFAYHPPKGQGIADLHSFVRGQLGQLASQLNHVLPSGREKALVMTHLEEAMMWANAAIARNQEGIGRPPEEPTSRL